MSAIIRVALSRKALQIEPGQVGELTVTIQNLSEIVDQYLIEIEGIDDTWVSASPSRMSLFPQDQGQVTVRLSPPGTARAGTYDLAVKVVSRENPVEWTTVHAEVEVAPVFLFDVGLAPQRKSTLGEDAAFRVRLSNPGNVDVTIGLSASDPEDACTYSFEPPQVVVGAGASAEASLAVVPRQPAGERAKLHSFTVKAVPVDAPQRAQTVSGQLECLPRVVSVELGLWPRRRSAVGAGSFQVQLDNRGNTDLTLSLEGTDPGEACAYRFEPHIVTVTAGQSMQIPLTVAPIGRPPADKPRLYEFTVRAVPENAPHKAVQTAGQLECLPVVISFDLEVVPAQRTGGVSAEYRVRLVNRCETELSLELSVSDVAGACDYSLEARQVSLGPEETRMVPLTVKVRQRPARGETERHDFSVTATPADAPHLAKRAMGHLELVRPQGVGILVWSIVGFALGNGVLMPLIWSGAIPEFEGALYLVFAVMGAVGGLLLGIGARRRVLLVCIAGALGLAPGGYLALSGSFEDVALQAIWGMFAGGLLGLALKYGWRAIAVAGAGALALPVRLIVGQGLWESPLASLEYEVAAVLIDVIIGALAGFVLGLPVLLLERWRKRSTS